MDLTNLKVDGLVSDDGKHGCVVGLGIHSVINLKLTNFLVNY